jgi:hypothetical protein
MSQFDLSSLNIDLTTVIPKQVDMQVLVEVFKDIIPLATEGCDYEKLRSFCTGIGETRLRGIARHLSNQSRIQVLDQLLPEVTEKSSHAVELVQRLLDTAPSLAALSYVMDKVGFERFDRGPVAKWFRERAALARCAEELKGEECLIDVDARPDDADLAINRIAEILQHNIDVFESRAQETACLPMALNARILLDAFNQSRWSNHEDPIEFASAWNERIKIHTTVGVGLYNTDELILKANEVKDIREGIEKFPAYLLLLENVLLRLDFKKAPEDREGALGGYHMGRISIYDSIREVQHDQFFEDLGHSAATFAAVHELSHVSHTVCMMDFKKLSGWISVSNWKFNDPKTNERITLFPDDFQPGSEINVGGGIYIVSEYKEPEEFEFSGIGSDAAEPITIKNPYIPAGTGYLYRKGSEFIDQYAATEPVEDYAQSLTYFLLDPDRLKLEAPEKFEFMNFLYGKVRAI